jgi:hypothetical protein
MVILANTPPPFTTSTEWSCMDVMRMWGEGIPSHEEVCQTYTDYNVKRCHFSEVFQVDGSANGERRRVRVDRDQECIVMIHVGWFQNIMKEFARLIQI